MCEIQVTFDGTGLPNQRQAGPPKRYCMQHFDFKSDPKRALYLNSIVFGGAV